MGSNRGSSERRRVAYVVCYRDPEYVRTLSLARALDALDATDLVLVKNRRRGALRYLETLTRSLVVRFRLRPDLWVVGFRGHEIFAALYPLMRGRDIVFDEFVNLHGWLVEERRLLRPDSLAIQVVDAYMRWVLKRSTAVLSDTDAQADYSSRVYRTPRSKFVVVPVGTDEETFFPRAQAARADGKLEVLFVGTMLPLHGTSVLLDAIRLLEAHGELAKLHFTLIGGRGKPTALAEIRRFIEENRLDDSVTHVPWVDYAELPGFISRADLCIGGPLGDTPQARRVVTGKTYQFLAMGRAVLVGDVDDATEFVDGENCLRVELGSAEAVAGAIGWAISHRDQLNEIGARGRGLYEHRFSVRHIADAVAPAVSR